MNAYAPRVLIADDDPAIRDLLVTRLELAGYWTAVASDGVEAISRMKALRPDGMILDLNMPRMDGFDVLRTLQARRGGENGPAVMVLSARGRPSDVKMAIGLGASDYLAKPFNSRALLARVARLVRGPTPKATPAPTQAAPPPEDDDSILL
jgi:DNA-binding response OmpR family regulator